MSPFALAFLLFNFLTICPSQKILRCSQQSTTHPPARQFHFVSPCARSSARVIASARISSLDICQRFAGRFQGFALNFMHRELLYGQANFTGDTCLVYDCPEFNVRTYAEKDTLYDYYSSYARPMPEVNATCVPYLGLFQLQRDHKNYSEAQEICEREGGRLAPIISEFYTVQLAAVLASNKVKEALVGLEQFNEEDFLTQSGLPLSCVKYRAWAPGEPKPIKDLKCVSVTSAARWKVVACKRRMPFFCEINRAGPYRPCQKIRKSKRRKECVKRFKSVIPRPGRFPKCGDPIWATVAETERRRFTRRNNAKNNRTVVNTEKPKTNSSRVA